MVIKDLHALKQIPIDWQGYMSGEQRDGTKDEA